MCAQVGQRCGASDDVLRNEARVGKHREPRILDLLQLRCNRPDEAGASGQIQPVTALSHACSLLPHLQAGDVALGEASRIEDAAATETSAGTSISLHCMSGGATS